MQKIVTQTEMRTLEEAAVAHGATWEGLMEQAGWGVAQVALTRLGLAKGRRVVVLVGPGNNGGDGLVVARHMHDAGAQVELYCWRRQFAPNDTNWQRCRTRGLAETMATDDPTQASLDRLLAAADLVVDALLGMGVSRPVEGDLAAIITTLQRQPHRPLVLAIDLPSGVDAVTGAAPGGAVCANVTVATGLPKRGLFLYPGRSLAGILELATLELPRDYLETTMSDPLSAAEALTLLPARPAEAHKGSFGKVLVLAGSLHFPGAAYLACAGAARVGAGLVTLAGGRAVIAGAMHLPEATLLPVAEGDWGAVGPGALAEVNKALPNYQALVLGPGMSQGEATREFLQRLLGLDTPKSRVRVGFLIDKNPDKAAVSSAVQLPPTVLDADGLNLLASIEGWPERLPHERFILTPHPGEMRRLLGVEELPADLVATTCEAAQRWGQVVVLKGATTIIASPDGRNRIHDGANPALATAGTGDVLAGAIGGLLAQGLAPYAAASLGVFLHGAAAVRVRATLGDAGALASDLLPELPRAISELKGSKK